jgi:Fe2+ transport system protein FeoA
MKISLFNLPYKKKAIIISVNTDNDIKERLHSFGLIKGVKISFIRNAPLGCPKIYKCLNTFIAIRSGLAKKITVELTNEKQ